MAENPLFADLEKRTHEPTNEVAEVPKQLVSAEELSQIRQRQIALKQDPKDFLEEQKGDFLSKDSFMR